MVAFARAVITHIHREYVSIAPQPDIPEDMRIWNRGTMPLFRNCWNFAANYLESIVDKIPDGIYMMDSQQPYLEDKLPLSSMAVFHIRKGISSFGFVPLNAKKLSDISSLHPTHYLVAAFARMGKTACGETVFEDYHFYRRHNRGPWLHKYGWVELVTNLDQSDNVIKNPLEADRGGYDTFIGFFVSPPSRQLAQIDVYGSNDDEIAMMWNGKPCQPFKLTQEDMANIAALDQKLVARKKKLGLPVPALGCAA